MKSDIPRFFPVIYASETGTAEDVAGHLAHLASLRGLSSLYVPMDHLEVRALLEKRQSAKLTVFMIATAGDGEVPRNMRETWAFLRKREHGFDFLKGFSYAVFGFGDSGYVKFNAAAKRLDRRLADLGGHRVLPLGTGNDQHALGYDAALAPWIEELWFKLAVLHKENTILNPPAMPLPPPQPRVKLEVGSRISWQHVNKWISGHACAPGQRILDSSVARILRITGERMLPERDVRLIVLSNFSSPLIYSPGDLVHVMPRNRDGAVRRFFQLTGFDENVMVNVIPTSPDYIINARTPMTLFEFVTVQLDIMCLPQRRVFEHLAYFAKEPRERDRLLFFASSEGTEERRQYVNKEQRSLLKVLEDFPSARPPIEYLVDLIPRLRPRPFSIASSPTAHLNEIHICAAMVRTTTPLRTIREGLCSSFFSRLEPGDIVPVYITKGSLTFPSLPLQRPVILVGPGTGIAPLRSFLWETYALSRGQRPPKVVLFTGCRKKEGDFLFAEEWKTLLESRILHTLCPAFSRDNVNEKYVQDQIRREHDLVLSILPTGSVFVAGSSGGMPRGVREAIEEVIAKVPRMTSTDAAATVQSMINLGRYQMECWR